MREREKVCVKCGATEENTVLELCSFCASYFCSDCAFKSKWGRFCSSSCSQTFFYGVDDDDSREDGDVDDYE